MKILGQPESYSEILQRVFWTTLATGLICTFVIAESSTAVKDFLSSLNVEIEIFSMKVPKTLYVLIPLIIAFLLRILKLHNLVSNIFGLRVYFDVHHILTPLATGVKISLGETEMKILKFNRVLLMRNVFYPYAGYDTTSIDTQLVRTALDNWGWLWVLIESSALLIISLLIVFLLFIASQGTLWPGLTLLFVFVFEFILILVFWHRCVQSATEEIDAILSKPDCVTTITSHFRQYL